MLLFALFACDASGGKPSAATDDTTECTSGPALSPAPEGFEPVLGEGAMVVFGEVCDGDPVFSWTAENVPEGVTLDDLLTYEDDEHAEAVWTSDVVGTYVTGVVVADPDGNVSAPDYFMRSVAEGNAAPVADCGDDLVVPVGEPVSLDGYGSYDPEARGLTYAWSFVSVPSRSAVTDASFDDATSAAPTFVPDAAGNYDVMLQVNDGEATSGPATCVISAS